MRGSLDPKDASKLAKVCGLLASDHDGERSAAALLATRILRKAGLEWPDLISTALPQRSPPPMQFVDHRDLARWALGEVDTGAYLTGWEIDFLSGIAEAEYTLSRRQRARLAEIVYDLRNGKRRR